MILLARILSLGHILHSLNYFRICMVSLLVQGLNFLYMHGLLNETSEDVASFLYRGEGLSKKMIGEFLGKM